jgi:hypothetical protein
MVPLVGSETASGRTMSTVPPAGVVRAGGETHESQAAHHSRRRRTIHPGVVAQLSAVVRAPAVGGRVRRHGAAVLAAGDDGRRDEPGGHRHGHDR